MHSSTPQLVNVLECLLGVDQVKFLPLVEMLDVELAISMIVAIVNNKVGIAKVCQAGNDAITYLLPVFLHDDPLIPLLPIKVEVEVLHKVFGQVVTQEGDIVVQFAYLKDLLATHARFTT